MQMRLSFYDKNLATEEVPFTGVYLIDYIEKEIEFVMSFDSEEKLLYEISNKEINHNDFDVIVDSEYIKCDGSFTLTLSVNGMKLYSSYNIKVFVGAGIFMIDSKRGFHYELMMNEEEIKKMYDELSKDRKSRKQKKRKLP